MASQSSQSEVVRQGVAEGFPRVAGLCPTCGANSLFLANGGHVTCSVLSCTAPCKADDLLHTAAKRDFVAERIERVRQDVIDAALESHRAAKAGRHHAGFNAKLSVACDTFDREVSADA